MNRNVLASINNICTELEAIGMYKEANELTNVMKKLAGRGDRATVTVQPDGKPVILISYANGGFERKLGYKRDGEFRYFENLQHAINYARKIDPNFEVDSPKPPKPRRVGPTGKPWTRDDQEMFDFEASKEDKFWWVNLLKQRYLNKKKD